MLRIVMFILGLLAPLGAIAPPAQAQDAGAIENVISGQLDAFNAGDVDTAWTYASPMIQGMFGNAANFGMMVQQGYPMVWSNGGAEFLELSEEGGQFRQTVLLRDSGGARWVLDYTMIQTENGWKINGVTVVPQPDVGV